MRSERELPVFEGEFAEYVESSWPAQAREIRTLRSSSFLVKYSYPLFGFLISLFIMGSVTAVATFVARHGLPGVDPGSAFDGFQAVFAQMLPPLWVATAVVVVVSVVLALSSGITRSRALILEAEKLCLALRTEFSLEKLTQVPHHFESRTIGGSAARTNWGQISASAGTGSERIPRIDIEPR